MFDYFTHVLEKISLLHLNILLLLGLSLFGGVVGGRLFQKLKIPQVVGYIIIGILIGKSGFVVVDANVIQALKPFIYFSLGIIGFMVGSELKKDVFLKYGKYVVSILLFEGITSFLLVTLFIGIIGSFLFGSGPMIWALALLLGAIAAATDPAVTISVLKEYKTKGPLTTSLLGIIALDDGLALVLFAIASSVAGILIGNVPHGTLSAILHPFYEIGAAIVVGGLAGLLLSRMLRKYGEKERVLTLSIGFVLLVTGLSLATNISLLMATMTLGVIVTNINPHKSKGAFNLIEGFASPIYVLFFVLIGANIEVKSITAPILALILVYLVSRCAGKVIGVKLGARLSKAPKAIFKYLPLTLFSQAGVAIGLSILASQYFPKEIGNVLVIIIAATTFITQLLGPPCTKFAVTKAKEVGLNITEEDILQQSKASDIMDKEYPFLYENMKLPDILRVFSEDDNLYYPVVDKENKLKGVATVEGIKQTFLEMDVGGLIVAGDLMEPVIAKASRDVSAEEVREILNRYDVDCLTIVDKDDRVEGFIVRKKFHKFLSTKMLELQRQVDSLDDK